MPYVTLCSLHTTFWLDKRSYLVIIVNRLHSWPAHLVQHDQITHTDSHQWEHIHSQEIVQDEGFLVSCCGKNLSAEYLGAEPLSS